MTQKIIYYCDYCKKENKTTRCNGDYHSRCYTKMMKEKLKERIKDD